MMSKVRTSWKIVVILIFIFANVIVWIQSQTGKPHDYVTVAFLNIGQGDAIFIESPTKNQIMIDGGPAHKVLAELRKVMPWYDRSINTLIVTNPDADHYAGFIDVLNNFKVDQVVEPGTISKTETYSYFENLVKDEHASTTLARRGMVMHLGGGADLYFLFPDRDVSKLDTNEGSIVAKLVYGSTSVMFTGDAPSATEEYAASTTPKEIPDGGIQSDILKVGHHGSRTSASESFVRAVNPHYAVISYGCTNRYGHPHKETLDLFAKLNVPVLSTCKQGTIIMKLNGTTIETEFRK
jgi:competence protein ComEC